MSKRIEKILKFALEADNAVEKDAFVRSALVLIEDNYPYYMSSMRGMSKDHHALKQLEEN